MPKRYGVTNNPERRLRELKNEFSELKYFYRLTSRGGDISFSGH